MARAAAFSLDALPSELVWKADRFARPTVPGIPTGHPALDAQLPGGGWPRGAIIELLSDMPGIGEIEFLLPMLQRAANEQLILWISPPWLPYAPALSAHGLKLAQLRIVTPDTRAARIWAIRQALSSAACHVVLAWLDRVDMSALRRLQLAAETSGTPLFLHRPLAASAQPSPACLRLQLAATDTQLSVTILKRRGPAAHTPLLLPLRRPDESCRNALDRTGLPGPAPAGFHPQLA